MRREALVAVVASTALLLVGARSGADEKAKDKAKTKPPVATYSDDDLKKYQDKPKDGEATPQAGSAGEAGDSDAPVPGQRRTREGHRNPPPPPPSPTVQEPAQADAPPAEEPKSAEEAEWRQKATQARAPLQAAEGRAHGIESQMADLRDKLNPMSTKYVLGGNSNAGPGAVLEVEEELRALDVQLADARAEAAQAEKSWQAFLEEARAAGASPAWLN